MLNLHKFVLRLYKVPRDTKQDQYGILKIKTVYQRYLKNINMEMSI